jgi:putative hydrolase of the HAD superfamily
MGDPAAVPFDAVVLDVGGVLVVPDFATIAAALAAAGLHPAAERWPAAHYRAMEAVDLHRPDAEHFAHYHERLAVELGLEDRLDEAVAILERTWETPMLWHEPFPGSADGLRSLVDAGVPVAIVSNSDGTVEQLLRDHGICQVGEGSGVAVACVVDSTVAGVAKPDPGIWTFALEVLGVAPDRAVHVGDSVHYDVTGARAAGLTPLHFDPYGLCPLDDHGHLRALTDLLTG